MVSIGTKKDKCPVCGHKLDPPEEGEVSQTCSYCKSVIYGTQARFHTDKDKQGSEPSVTRDGERGWKPWRPQA